MAGERWRKSSHPCYEVSSFGKVRRSKRAKGTVVGTILKPLQDPRGYVRVVLSNRSVLCNRWVHRLVAEAFLGPCPRGMNVNHRNGIKSDNRVANLEYVTFSGNTRHALRSGLIAKGSDGRFRRAV